MNRMPQHRQFAKQDRLMAEELSQQTQEAAVNNASVAAAQVPQGIRNLHSKAVSALERDNLDFAIEMFMKVVENAPNYLAARRNLRLAAVAKFKRARKGAMTHQIASLTGIPKKLKIMALMKAKKPDEALMAAEELLLIDPLHIGFGKIYAQVALAAGQTEAAVMTLEIIREQSPTKIEAVEALGRLYHEIKNYRAARECLEKVFVLKPNNAEIAKLLKDAEAFMTLDSGWEEAHREGKNYQSVLADKEQAVQLERASKAVKSEEDAEALIEEARTKIKAEPANLNYYLNLGSLFVQQKRYDEAIQIYEDARKVNPADPEIDRRMNAATVSRFDAAIAALTAEGKKDEAAAKTTERDQYIFDELVERVQRYPNDLRLRYEMGMQYVKYERYDDAIQQLQLAVRSPKDRVQALYNLARCFRVKGLLDMAAMQLEQALEVLPGMNAEKMEVMYEIAEIFHEEGRLDDAANYFKEIYRHDVTFKDISKKIESIYAAQKAAEGK